MDENDWVDLKDLLRKLNIKHGRLTDNDAREFYRKCKEYDLIDDIRIISDLFEV